MSEGDSESFSSDSRSAAVRAPRRSVPLVVAIGEGSGGRSAALLLLRLHRVRRRSVIRHIGERVHIDERNENVGAKVSIANQTAALPRMTKKMHAEGQGRARIDPQESHCLEASGRARALRERAGQSVSGASGAKNLGARNQQLVVSRILRLWMWKLVRTGHRLR